MGDNSAGAFHCGASALGRGHAGATIGRRLTWVKIDLFDTTFSAYLRSALPFTVRCVAPMISTPESISREPDRVRVLPDFTNPPLNEVVLSIQFAPLVGLKSVHIGLFWERVRSEYPNVTEQAPIQAAFETFGIPAPVPALQIETLMNLPLPRYWFERPNAPDLLQIQQDRILHNWRQQVDNSRVYPRYEAVKASLKKELEIFQKWLAEEEIGEIKPNQCEVTYVNVISTGEDKYEHLEKITPLWAGVFSSDHPNTLERPSTQTTFLFSVNDVPAGRVYVNFQPAFLPSDRTPVFRMEITARGRPRGESVADALSFLDIERDQVVRTFAAVTTKEMHKLWERTDAKR
jgi:uncharacterized protein (TIGR04255 family)